MSKKTIAEQITELAEELADQLENALADVERLESENANLKDQIDELEAVIRYAEGR